MNTSNGGLYYKVTTSNWEEYNLSLQYVVQDDIFYNNNRRILAEELVRLFKDNI